MMMGSPAVKANPEASKGVLNLSGYSLSSGSTISLNGEWEFYWKELLTISDFKNQRIKHDAYIELPNLWDNIKTSDIETEPFGYATHRLVVILNNHNIELGLKIPHTFSSYRLYVDDELVSSNGKVADDKEKYIPQTLPKTVRFHPKSDTINIILQVANFSFFKGGAPATIVLGSEENITSLRTRTLALDLFVFGALLITGIYHFVLYILRRKDISTFYFSLFCLFLSFRTIALGETFFIELFPSISFDIHVKLLFASFFLGAVSFIRFLYTLFPSDFSDRFTKIYIYIGIVTTGLLILPLYLCGYVNIVFQIITAVYIVYITYKLVYITVKKNEGGLVALIGLIVMVIAGVNDILYDNQIINTGYYSPYGLLIFIFSQSALLALKFSKAFTHVENLTFELTATNITFRKFVPEEFLKLLNRENFTKIERGEQIERSMSIMFADIRSFTELSETMEPQDNFNFINSYLDRMAPIIRHNNGFIDKYIGDAIMALFPSTADDAVKTALEMQEEMKNFNSFRKKLDLEPINIGIGMHFGSMMLGVIGESERLEGTVISDTVNVASHVENLTKVFGNKIIITQSILDNLSEPSSISYRYIGNVFVKKKKVPVSIYEIYSCCDSELMEIIDKTKDDFESAVHLYNDKKYTEAVEKFNNVITQNPKDVAALQLRGRAESIIEIGTEARPSDSIFIFSGKKDKNA